MWRVYFYVFVVLKVVSSHLVSRTDLVVYVLFERTSFLCFRRSARNFEVCYLERLTNTDPYHIGSIACAYACARPHDS